MAMHIRHTHTHELVKEIARATGDTQEAVVQAAVEQYAATLRTIPRARVDQVLAEGAAIGRLLGLTPGDDATAFLYGDDGLPR